LLEEAKGLASAGVVGLGNVMEYFPPQPFVGPFHEQPVIAGLPFL
jgi:hypothetical protein